MNRCWMGYRYAYLVWRCTMHLELMLQIYLTNLILYKSGVNTVNYHNLVLFKQEMHNLAHIIVLDFDILCASPKSSRNLQYINIWENLCRNSKFSKNPAHPPPNNHMNCKKKDWFPVDTFLNSEPLNLQGRNELQDLLHYKGLLILLPHKLSLQQWIWPHLEACGKQESQQWFQ